MWISGVFSYWGDTMYLPRASEQVIGLAASQFPAVVLTGPRQSGKTTTLRRILGADLEYVSLDTPDARAFAISDPRAFLALHRPPVILDEVQQAPALLSYLRAAIDDHRDVPGQYILSGSQNLLLLAKVTETLAGRAAILRLLPMTLREAAGVPDASLPWQVDVSQRIGRSAPTIASHQALWRQIVRGFYPQLVASPEMSAALWHASYVQTYLERDVRSVRQIGDLHQFQIYLGAVAARTGQALNIADLARDIGIPPSTCKAWLSVLEATHQILIVPPYHRNVGKRLAKAPKVYLADTGTACYLCGITTAEQASQGPMAGALFETAVVQEAYKAGWRDGVPPRLYYWRTEDGAEVDLVIDRAGRLTPIEAKVNATPRIQAASGIRRFSTDYASSVEHGWVVHTGDVTMPLSLDVTAVPFGAV